MKSGKIQRTDSAQSITAPTKATPTRRLDSSHGREEFLLRSVSNNANIFESLHQLDADAQRELGRGFLLEKAHAGTFSRLSGRALVRVGDREVAGFFHEDTKRVMLALPGRYKACPINPLQLRKNVTLQNVDTLDRFKIGPVTYQKLAPFESCIVKQPDGSFSIESESFVSVCLGAPMHVGTIFRHTALGAEAAMQGARRTDLQAGGSHAGQFVELAAGHRGIYWQPHKKALVETEAETSFHLPADATLRVVKTVGCHETVKIADLHIVDGELDFHAAFTSQITNAGAFAALPYADVQALVVAEARRVLTKQLDGFTRAELFEGTQISDACDASKSARRALATARSSISAACQNAGVELNDFVLKPCFADHLAKAAADVGLTHVHTLQERMKQPLLAENHNYALAAAVRAGELEITKAESQRQREDILKDTPASRRADKIADKAYVYPAWTRNMDLSLWRDAIARTEG